VKNNTMILKKLDFAPTKKHFGILFLVAFLVRAATLLLFIQNNGYYKQADSLDYHNSAISIAAGYGMHRPDNGQPIFWRTPGYPLYLAFFYKLFGIHSGTFEANSRAQQASLWVQVFLGSLIPIILFFLAHLLTNSYVIAWLTAWASAFHLGLILASTYILSEGISIIFFYLFLLFFYPHIIGKPPKQWIRSLIFAALSLSAYTWIRPMGEFVGYLSALFLIFFASGNWRLSFKKGIFFFLLFFASIFPWYVRNHNLTGEWFFCPTLGTYLNCFSAPKIVRRIYNMDIVDAWKLTQQAAAQQTQKAYLALQGTGLCVSPSVAKNISYPIVFSYPLYFVRDWIYEVAKTVFDLYASQLAAMANNTFFYDPIEEFLGEKIAACLWAQPMSFFMRAICIFEFLFSVLLWVGLAAGFLFFLIRPFFVKGTRHIKNMRWLWLNTGLMIGLAVFMTGGFGYARLRLPVEPLLIVLALTFWLHVIKNQKPE